MPDDINSSGGRTAGGPVHMLIGHAGAPLSWAVNPGTPPYYDAVELRHGHLRVRANRTALTMQARATLVHCCPAGTPSCTGVHVSAGDASSALSAVKPSQRSLHDQQVQARMSCAQQTREQLTTHSRAEVDRAKSVLVRVLPHAGG